MLILKMTTTQTIRATKMRWVKMTSRSHTFQSQPPTAVRPDGKRYAPYTGARKEAGSLAIPDPTFNRNPALPGTPDPSLYRLTISFNKVDPDDETKRIPAKTASTTRNYLDEHPAPSWESLHSLMAFSRWRKQLIARYLGNKRKTREPWLIREQQLATSLLRAQLERAGKSKPKWNSIANEFNKRLNLAGTIQLRGEPLIAQRIQEDLCLPEDRLAPFRTALTIQAKTTHQWPASQKILRDAEEARRVADDTAGNHLMASDDERHVADSADEKAIPDPAPGGPKLSDRLCRTTIRVEARVTDEDGCESGQYEDEEDAG